MNQHPWQARKSRSEGYQTKNRKKEGRVEEWGLDLDTCGTEWSLLQNRPGMAFSLGFRAVTTLSGLKPPSLFLAPCTGAKAPPFNLGWYYQWGLKGAASGATQKHPLVPAYRPGLKDYQQGLKGPLVFSFSFLFSSIFLVPSFKFCLFIK